MVLVSLDHEHVVDNRLDHRHRLQRIDVLIDRGLDGPLERVEDPSQAPAKRALALELTLHLRQVPAHGLLQADPGVVQQRGDLLETQAQSPQGEDTVQPPDVLLGIKTVTGGGPL